MATLAEDTSSGERRWPRPSWSRGLERSPALLCLRPPVPHSRRARSACARCGSTVAASSTSPGATSAAWQCDPIEKNPFFHAHPGGRWQKLRHARVRSPLFGYLPELGDVTSVARSRGYFGRRSTRHRGGWWRRRSVVARKIVVSTYNEPLITWEWAVEMFRDARRRRTRDRVCFQRQGTPAGVGIPPTLGRLYKVDLKSFDDRHYRQLGGRLEPILGHHSSR